MGNACFALYDMVHSCMARLADHIYLVLGMAHKYNVRLGCTCPKCGEISLKSLSDAESDPLLYESDCTELEKGIADIRYYRCSSCGKLLKHRIQLDKRQEWHLLPSVITKCSTP